MQNTKNSSVMTVSNENLCRTNFRLSFVPLANPSWPTGDPTGPSSFMMDHHSPPAFLLPPPFRPKHDHFQHGLILQSRGSQLASHSGPKSLPLVSSNGHNVKGLWQKISTKQIFRKFERKMNMNTEFKDIIFAKI